MAKGLYFTVIVKTENGTRRFPLQGRQAWTMLQLVRAGEKGCTPIERPAPRWSDYVFQLRGLGLNIRTIREKHTGTFPGEHGRYVLLDDVELVGGNLADWKAA